MTDNEENFPTKIGYCPWCSAEMSPMSYDPYNGQIEWMRCKTRRCKGTYKALVTDSQGFVIAPYNIRGRYIFSAR